MSQFEDYETQADRFGYGQPDKVTQLPPKLEIEHSIVFTEEQIKAILADYVRKHFDLPALPSDVKGDYRAAIYGHGYEGTTPAYCKFTVKVKK